MQVLDDPGGCILNKGGFIYLAADGANITSSGALIKNDEKEYELAKMGVEGH